MHITDNEAQVLRRALSFYYDNLNDDQHEGGDHELELSNLEGIFRNHPELSPQ